VKRNFGLEFVKVTEATAIAAARHMGKGDEASAQRAAVSTMREQLCAMSVHCQIALGEGEQSSTTVLYNGEVIPAAGEERVDLALDALEGTNICATGGPNSISVIAIGEPGSFFVPPETYMEKIAVGSKAKGIIDLHASPTENLRAIAEALQCYVEDLTVVVLDRPRHAALVEEIRRAGARVRLIGDGDVSAAIATAIKDSGIDVLLGIGGAAQGVLAAAALKGMGGDMQGRLVPRSNQEREKIRSLGIPEKTQVLQINDLVCGKDIMCVATGITDGDVLKGVRFVGQQEMITHSLVIRSLTGTTRFIRTEHRSRSFA
jgi:fructose-1,6-bisphosphatase II